MVTALVTMRSIRDPETVELRDSLSRDWTSYLDGLDVTIVPSVNGIERPGSAIQRHAPDVLLLTNGEDVGSHPPRDRTERALVESALEAGVPVLGVCRGHQFLNDYFGGDLVDLSARPDEYQSHGGSTHDVEVFDRPPSAPLPGELGVNSYHDFGVTAETVAPGLEPFAQAKDGVVEGLFHPEEPILSIQWHPERPLPNRPPVDTLISRFLHGSLTW